MRRVGDYASIGSWAAGITGAAILLSAAPPLLVIGLVVSAVGLQLAAQYLWKRSGL